MQSSKKYKKAQLIKQDCLNQSNHFVQWDKKNDYRAFHHSHYDWWAFPYDQPSSKGQSYKIGQPEYEYLSSDTDFLSALKTNSILVCRAWGYDLPSGKELKNKNEDQRWQNWPIRLYKMARSLQIFMKGEDQILWRNAVIFGNKLISRKCKFIYGRKHLDDYFIEKANFKSVQTKLLKLQKEPQSLQKVRKTISNNFLQQTKRPYNSVRKGPNIQKKVIPKIHKNLFNK